MTHLIMSSCCLRHMAWSHMLSCFMLFLVGAASLNIPSGYSLAYALGVVLGIYALLARKITCRAVYADLWLLFLPLWVFAVIGLGISYIHHNTMAHAVDSYGRYAIGPLIALGVYAFKPSVRAWWYGLCVGLLVAAVLVVYQKFYLSFDRASGFMNAIQFGNLAMLLGMLCFAGMMGVWCEPSARLKYLLLVCGVLGMLCSFLSGSRGGWIALPLMVVLMIHAFYTSALLSRHQCMTFFFVFCLVLGLVYGIKQTGVAARLAEVHADWVQYMDQNNGYSSLGIRLDLWRMALMMIPEELWLGWSDAAFYHERAQQIAAGRLPAYLQDFTHMHQEFLEALLKQGVLGLSSLLLLYLAPLYFFRQYYRAAREHLRLRALALSGMMVPLMYIDFGLSQAFLSHNSGRLMYIVMVMVLGALCIQQKNNLPIEP